MYKILKFICEVDEHKETDFFIKVTFLAPVIFWSMRSEKIDWKMTKAKKAKILKNQFLHARQLCKGIFLMTVFWNFEFLFQIFWLKLLLMVSTLSGLMGSGIQE